MTGAGQEVRTRRRTETLTWDRQGQTSYGKCCYPAWDGRGDSGCNLAQHCAKVSRPGAEGTKGEALDLEELTVKKHKSNSGLFFFKIYLRENERENRST